MTHFYVIWTVSLENPGFSGLGNQLYKSPILGSSIHATSQLRLTIDATLGTSFSSMNEQPIRYIQSAISEHDHVAELVEVAEPVSLPFQFLDPRVC